MVRKVEGVGSNSPGIVERLRKKYSFDISGRSRVVGLPQFERISGSRSTNFYRTMTIDLALDVLGEDRTGNALEVFNSSIPRVIRAGLGRMPHAKGFDQREDVLFVETKFIEFVGYLGRHGDLNASQGIHSFIEEMDKPYGA